MEKQKTENVRLVHERSVQQSPALSSITHQRSELRDLPVRCLYPTQVSGFYSVDEAIAQALILASESNAIDDIRSLLQEHANPNLQDKVIVFGCCISTSCMQANAGRVRRRLTQDHSFSPFQDGRTALMKASFMGHTDVAHLLLEHGANPNLCDSHGVGALLVATEKNHTELVHLLLERGADPDSVQVVIAKSECIVVACQGLVLESVQPTKLSLHYDQSLCCRPTPRR